MISRWHTTAAIQSASAPGSRVCFLICAAVSIAAMVVPANELKAMLSSGIFFRSPGRSSLAMTATWNRTDITPNSTGKKG